MLSRVMAESSISQHPVFKSNFQFSIADCSAARLPEKKFCLVSFLLFYFCFFLSDMPFFIPHEKLPVYYMVKVSLCVYSLHLSEYTEWLPI